MEAFASGSLGTHKKESKKTKRPRANQKGSSRYAKQKVREQSTNKEMQSINKDSNRQRQAAGRKCKAEGENEATTRKYKAEEKRGRANEKQPRGTSRQMLKERSKPSGYI